MKDDRLEIASFRTICEKSPIGIFVCDENGSSLYANSTNLRQMGLTAEEAAGDGWQRAIHPDDRDLILQRYAEALGMGEIYEEQNRYLLPDGSVVWVDVRIAAISDSGKILGFVGTAIDVTLRKRLEEELRRSERMKAVGRMAGAIAHDFNNLLVAILGHAEIAANSPGDREVLDCSLAAIIDAAEQAAGLTRQLLTVAKQEVVKPEVLEIGSRLSRLSALLKGAIRENIELRLEAADSVAPILIDPMHFQRLVLNLVLNAQDAIDGSGQITIRARNFEAPDRSADPWVELSVEDSGMGMTRSSRARIFEPFFTEGRRFGTGLGLSICHAIVQRAGGSIDVQSAPGEGSIFRILIPATSRRCEHESREGDTKERSGDSSRRLLLVEDNPAVREVLAKGLRARQFEVAEADSFGQAVRVASVHPGAIDLVICDVVLGDGSGLKLQEQLEALRPDLRFLFVSGYANDPAFRERVERGEIPFLGKPFSLTTLVEQVERVLADDSASRRGAPVQRSERDHDQIGMKMESK